MLFTARVECPVYDSFRVQQVAGLFDMPLAEKCRQSFQVELPDPDEAWQIGVIVGPSGSGKTTVARQAFGDALYEPRTWATDRAVIDGFGDLPTKDITQLLTAVGLGSPPSWVKPYHVLSNGEKFRCDLARALLQGSGRRVQGSGLVVFDEFTSVVDRTVAQIGSAAVARAIRSGRLGEGANPNANANVEHSTSNAQRRTNANPKSEMPDPKVLNPEPSTTEPSLLRFVAVTCHYDVLPWLAPDWVLDMTTGQLTRGRLRRPEIRLDLYRARRAAWPLFAKHHYLNPGLAAFAACYVALWNDTPVGFVAVVSLAGHKGRRRISRVVVLPDFQGLGIGGRLTSAVAARLAAEGLRVSITTSHPAMIGWLRRAVHWKITAVYRCGGHTHQTLQVGRRNEQTARHKGSTGRAVVSATFNGRLPRDPAPFALANGGRKPTGGSLFDVISVLAAATSWLTPAARLGERWA